MLNETLLNRYRLDARLGQGGMGVVYRAQDLLLKRSVAVKVLSNTTLSEDGRRRLLNEAQSIAALNHPNIVTVYDVGELSGAEGPSAGGETGSTPFIVMELVQGSPLSQVTVHSVPEVVEVICQVCAALEHAHAVGMIHRDLKLENVLLTPNKTVKLMDFGLAKMRDTPRLTQTGTLLGTFLYMAPELLMGQAASVQSDLYALGVMFYELTCGQPPFRGDDPLGIVSQHLHSTPVPPSTYNPAISPEVETLILRLLDKQPADRPASAMEVRHILEATGRGGKAAFEGHIPLDRVVRGRMVRRERELDQVMTLWSKAQQGESGILLISGEPGIGKSRLARELVVRVQVEGGLALVGECYAEGGGPYAPFVQMILATADWPEDLPQLVLADLISLAPALRVRYPDTPLNPPLEPQAEQQRLYESAFTFFSSLAARAPLLLVLEDMHWSDGGTLALARSLVRRFEQTHTPAFLLLTFREGELSGQKGLSELLNVWNRERRANSLKLRRLDRQGTQDMLVAMFSEPVSAEFADVVYHETEGNPFFIEELCKALIDDGQVYREKGRWQRRSTSSIELPRNIRMAIETRLGRLSPETQDVLHLAAVLGRRFEFDVLLGAADPAAGQDEDALIDALEAAERAQLLFEVGREGGGTFEFAHALIPTTLVEDLSGMRCRRLNQRAAHALEALHPQDAKALAHYYLEAGQDRRALDALLQAGQQAQAAFANAEAVATYQQAIGLLDEFRRSPDQDGWQSVAVQLYERLGDVLELTGQHEPAWDAYQSALDLVPAGEGIQRAGLLRKAGKTRETLRLYDEADRVYRQAETALGPPAERDDRAWWQAWADLQLDWIYLYYWPGRVQEMLELVEKVRPELERYATSQQRSKLYDNISLALMRRDRYVISDEILEYAHQAVAILKETGESSLRMFAEFELGFCLLWHGDINEAIQQMQVVLRMSEQTGDVTMRTRCLVYLTMAYRKLGDIENVKTFAARSLDAAAIGQMIEYIGMSKANQAWAMRREGKLIEANLLAEAGWELVQKTVQAQNYGWVAGWVLVALHLAQDELAQAVDSARILCDPKAQPQPEAIAARLQAAIQAWEEGDAPQANAELIQAANLAEPLGYI